MSCPFYGRSLVVLVQSNAPLLIDQAGNRCALITSAHSPCWMEAIEHNDPDWSECPRNPAYLSTGPEFARDFRADRISNAIFWLDQAMSMRSPRKQ